MYAIRRASKLTLFLVIKSRRKKVRTFFLSYYMTKTVYVRLFISLYVLIVPPLHLQSDNFRLIVCGFVLVKYRVTREFRLVSVTKN